MADVATETKPTKPAPKATAPKATAAAEEPTETKEQRFRRIASKRTGKALQAIKLIGNCSSRASYGYGELEVNKIFGALEAAVADTRAKFKIGDVAPDEVDMFNL